MAKDIINQYHVKPFKVFTVFNGIDTNIFKRKKEKGEEVRKRYNIKLNEKLILMLGRIEKLKGFQYGVYALKEILKQKENVKLMIVGRGGYENKLKELTKKLDLESKVIFAGEVENRECPDYYNACDIFINPSLHVEAFPTVLIEVMACGRPVISTNLGGTRSAIESGENGILINSADPKEIADAVLKLLNNQTLAENLSKKAEEKAIKIFTIENSINGTERILRWALEYKNAEQNFKIKSENFECLANSIKTFIRFKGLEKHLLIINKTIETSKCPVGSPIFMIRVDDFPRWDIDTKEFLKFHSVLKSYNLPYLLGVTPNLC
ncbi:MAG: glycosyltransferase family 4 protein, partial [Candidatus Nanoarchaeia archaeon]